MVQPEHDTTDTGDLIDPNAPDPTGDEVVDPEDPSWVEPANEAEPVLPL